MLRLYVADGTDGLSPATLKSYSSIVDSLIEVFGTGPIHALKPSMVAKYLETQRKAGHGARANRKLAVLSSAYNFAMRQGWTDVNPCRGVRRNKEIPRRRYVTDAEFRAAFEAAPEPFQDLLAVALLTGARQGDLRSWTAGNVTDAGIVYTESKTGKPRIVSWSPALKFFVDRAAKRRRADCVATLLVNKFGQPWTEWAIHSQMRRQQINWRFHDIRAKGATDAEHNLLGHRSDMLRVYKRKDAVRPLR
ncbi:MAG: site-specific integrase [Gammaproteobacteria bacterium]|nr:site-specific integrase [Gammaproteobacteria bacterium]